MTPLPSSPNFGFGCPISLVGECLLSAKVEARLELCRTAGGRGGVDFKIFRSLDGEGADTAGAALDQERLACLHQRLVEEVGIDGERSFG